MTVLAAIFTDAMIGKLSRLKGRNLSSIVFADLSFAHGHDHETYSKIRLVCDALCIEIFNEQRLLSDGSEQHEFAFFECEEASASQDFFPLISNTEVITINIDAPIQSVSIVRDTVSINDRNGDFAITFDMAIDIKTDRGRYILSKGWFFDEDIFVDKDRSFDEIYPVEKVRSDWYDEDLSPMTVDVKREVIEL